jgi:hypothetical protein
MTIAKATAAIGRMAATREPECEDEGAQCDDEGVLEALGVTQLVTLPG